MQKIIKSLICILLFIVVALGVSIATGNQVTKEERQKNRQKINTTYANIIYAFSSNKEKDLLRVATNVIRNEIIYINKDDEVETNRYAYLCPMLNNSFKNLILNYINEEENEYIDKNITKNFQKERENFTSGYEKLLSFCNRVR